MGKTAKRRVEMTAVMADDGYTWNFWTNVEVDEDASDADVMGAAREAAMAAFDRDNVATSLVEPVFIEPLDE